MSSPPTPNPDLATVAVTRRMTKQALTTISRTLERTAESLGETAAVIGLFQYETYFEPQAASFRRLGTNGVSTIAVYHSDSGSTPAPGHVHLTSDDPLTRVWAAVLVSDSLSGFVHAVDLDQYGDTSQGVEPARLFDAEVGFSSGRTARVATELLDALDAAGLDPERSGETRRRIAASRHDPVGDARPADAVVDAWAHGMDMVTNRLASISEAWRGERLRATSDALTGLSNRNGLDEWIGGAATAEVPTAPIGVVMFDMSGFKEINDTLGHEAGDDVLRRVADVIRRHVRKGDLAVRWGGDEFVLLCPGVDDESQLRDLAYRISTAVSSIHVDGLHAAVDFGVQVCTRRPLSFDRADEDLYRAKQTRPT